MKRKKIFKKLLPILLSMIMIIGLLTPLDINAAQVANPSSMNVGDYMRFNYTGGIQTFTAPKTGVYKLETYGAQGGNMSSGGKGGYATGTVTLTAGQTIYIVVGGAGAFNNTTKNHFAAGGYNGGGNGYEGSVGTSARSHGGGGGATHIAFVSGTLSSIGYASAITNNNLLIVAGGGGGTGDWYTGSMSVGTGGLGGGLTGTPGYSNESTLGWSGSNQTAGNAFGQGGNASGSYLGEGGGGGGLYGGRSGGTHYYGGGGGSGYVSSSLLKSTNMSTGINLGNGYAIVTLSSLAGATLTLDNQGATTNGTTTVATTLGSVLPSITVPTKLGYTFNGYYESVNGAGTQYYSGLGISNFIANSSVDKTVYAQWIPSSNTLYTVNHYQMELNGADYSLIESETLFGTTDSFVIPNTKNYTGFASPDTQSITIAADGTSVLNYYYTRNKYTLTLTKGIGIDTITGAGSIYFGQSITAKATLQPGYSFKNWTGTTTSTEVNYTFTMPANAVNLNANATANTNTNYIVKHYKEDLKTNTYTLEETKSLTGTPGDFITPDVNVYQGFTSPNTQTSEIKGDGTTIISYYYERNQYEVIINKDAGIETVVGDGFYEYEENVILSATVKSGYTLLGFIGDKTETTFTMPASNQTINIVSIKNNYTITYQLNGGYALNKTEYTVEDDFTLQTPNKIGYAFIGWTGSNGLTPEITVEVSNKFGDLNYIAHYELAHTHTLGPWTMITNPTTTETGLMGKYCTIDGELIKTMVLPKLSGGSFVLGEYNDPNNTTDDSEDDTDVYAYQTSSYQVTIPKTLVADGRTGLLDYTIGVKGNLASTDYVLVQPETSFFMKSVNKEDIFTTIHQSTNTFSYAGGVRNNQSANALGSIAMADISAGKWAGIFTFIISSNVDIATPNSIASTVEDINNNPVIGTDTKQNQITDYKIIQD